MRTALFILFGLLVCAALSGSPQHSGHGDTASIRHAYISPDADTLVWSAGRPLQWSDFHGRVDSSAHAMALSWSSLRYRFHCRNDSLLYNVRAVFFRDSSWVHPQGRSRAALEHEQLHFDLTEAYARRIRKACAEWQSPCADTLGLRTLVANLAQEWKQAEALYDAETAYGNSTMEQQRWARSIRRQLDSLEQYAHRGF